MQAPTIWLTIVAIALPTLLYIRIVHSIDRFEKEPTRYLVAAFLWGAVPAIILGLVLELILAMPVEALLGNGLASQFVQTGVVAPVVEEVLKGLAVILLYLWKRHEFDGWVDGIVYGSTVGFGFAFVENIFYIAGTETWGDWISIYFLRVVVFGFMHGFWTSLTGIGLGVARNSHSRLVQWGAPLLGLSAAILGHLLHNGSLVLADSTSGATILVAGLNYLIMVVLLIGLGLVAARHDSDMLRTYLRDEVPTTISEQDYAALSSIRSNAQSHFLIAPKDRRNFIHLAADLAQKKRLFIRMGEEGRTSTEIDRLRAALQTLSVG